MYFYLPRSRLAFPLIRAAWAGESFPAVLFLGRELFGFNLVGPMILHWVFTLLW
jgi:hypothetical protein